MKKENSKWIEDLYTIEREDREKFMWSLIQVVATKNSNLITEAVALFVSEQKKN
jgi:predicted RecB family endonuclease